MRCFICGVVTSAQRGPLTSDRATQEKCICASPRQRVWDVKTWCSAGRPTARETLGNVSKRIDRSPKPQVARSSRAGSANVVEGLRVYAGPIAQKWEQFGNNGFTESWWPLEIFIVRNGVDKPLADLGRQEC
jgi:hypothetical protein